MLKLCCKKKTVCLFFVFFCFSVRVFFFSEWKKNFYGNVIFFFFQEESYGPFFCSNKDKLFNTDSQNKVAFCLPTQLSLFFLNNNANPNLAKSQQNCCVFCPSFSPSLDCWKCCCAMPLRSSRQPTLSIWPTKFLKLDLHDPPPPGMVHGGGWCPMGGGGHGACSIKFFS